MYFAAGGMRAASCATPWRAVFLCFIRDCLVSTPTTKAGCSPVLRTSIHVARRRPSRPQRKREAAPVVRGGGLFDRFHAPVGRNAHHQERPLARRVRDQRLRQQEQRIARLVPCHRNGIPRQPSDGLGSPLALGPHEEFTDQAPSQAHVGEACEREQTVPNHVHPERGTRIQYPVGSPWSARACSTRSSRHRTPPQILPQSIGLPFALGARRVRGVQSNARAPSSSCPAVLQYSRNTGSRRPKRDSTSASCSALPSGLPAKKVLMTS